MSSLNAIGSGIGFEESCVPLGLEVFPRDGLGVDPPFPLPEVADLLTGFLEKYVLRISRFLTGQASVPGCSCALEKDRSVLM